MCRPCLALLVALCSQTLTAATLERLSLNQMTERSTAIVRARVTATHSIARGALIFTAYRLQISEQWKVTGTLPNEVLVPGGSLRRAQQTFSGAPRLEPGTDYVLFLWTGPSGATQIIGLSQGLFELQQQKGQLIAFRAGSTEEMVDASGAPVQDATFSLPVSDLNARVRRALASRGGSR
jgi:hypothetical protein